MKRREIKDISLYTVIRAQTDIGRLKLIMPVLSRRRVPGEFYIKKVAGGRYNLYSTKYPIEALAADIAINPAHAEIIGEEYPVKRLEAIRFSDMYREGKMALDIHLYVGEDE